MSRRPRRSKSELVKWLLDHQAVWEGFPKVDDRPAMKSQQRKIVEAMQEAGLFSRRSDVSGWTLDKLISQARAIRRMSQDGLKELCDVGRN